jgi:hypothetical protein
MRGRGEAEREPLDSPANRTIAHPREKEMQPIRCASCGEKDFYYGQLTEGFVLGPGLLSSHARPGCAVCLSRGSANLCLRKDQLEKVKARKAKEQQLDKFVLHLNQHPPKTLVFDTLGNGLPTGVAPAH